MTFWSDPTVSFPRSTCEFSNAELAGADVRTALYEMLKRDEVKIKGQVAAGCCRATTKGVLKGGVYRPSARRLPLVKIDQTSQFGYP